MGKTNWLHKSSPPSPQDPQYLKLRQAASQLIQTQGLEKLTVRRVAEESACSTMLVYKHFGSKNGLLDALFVEGFEHLIQMQNELRETSDPAELLMALCTGYRRVALAYPRHYQIMTLNINDYTPSSEAAVWAKNSLSFLEEAAGSWLKAQQKPTLAPPELAHQLFASCHGWVNLEINGFLPPNLDAEKALKTQIQNLLKGTL